MPLSKFSITYLILATESAWCISAIGILASAQKKPSTVTGTLSVRGALRVKSDYQPQGLPELFLYAGLEVISFFVAEADRVISVTALKK